MREACVRETLPSNRSTGQPVGKRWRRKRNGWCRPPDKTNTRALKIKGSAKVRPARKGFRAVSAVRAVRRRSNGMRVRTESRSTDEYRKESHSACGIPWLKRSWQPPAAHVAQGLLAQSGRANGMRLKTSGTVCRGFNSRTVRQCKDAASVR